jgi:undecaprenyl-diphosphatase
MVYRRKILELLRGAFGFLSSGFGEGRAEARYIGYMVAASLPAAVVGLLLRDSIEVLFDSPRVTAIMLILTSVVLAASRRRREGRELGLKAAMMIGVAQAIAIIPGCSRSGWTITTALLIGIGFADAAEFSFLISIPAILGALLLEIWTNPIAATLNEVMPLVIGGLVAFLAGWFALRLLLRILRTGSMHRFSYYLAALGIAALLFFTLRS